MIQSVATTPKHSSVATCLADHCCTVAIVAYRESPRHCSHGGPLAVVAAAAGPMLPCGEKRSSTLHEITIDRTAVFDIGHSVLAVSTAAGLTAAIVARRGALSITSG
jgi:hypothetical protein